MIIRQLTILMAAWLLWGCGDGRHGPQSAPPDVRAPFEVVDLPVAGESGQPRLAATGASLLASWVEVEDGTASLQFSTWGDRGWSRPQTAARGDDWFVNWADTPGVVPLTDGTLLAFYLQRTGPQPYAYGIRIIRSDDGVTWAGPVIPHQDGPQVEYGFVSVVPKAAGSARVVWLDGTAMEGHDHGASDHEAGPMALRTALLGADLQLTDERVLDDRVCECCPTAAAHIADAVFVAYRDRDEDEIRDISVRRVDPGDDAHHVVGPDQWQIAGCPVNGPALDAAGEQLVVAWYTGAGGGRVQVVFSTDAGVSFSEPVRIDDGRPIGRVDLRALPDGTALVSWIERTDAGAELRLKRVDPSGRVSASMVAADISEERRSGMPRMALQEGYVWLAWVDTDARSVRMARAALESIPDLPPAW